MGDREFTGSSASSERGMRERAFSVTFHGVRGSTPCHGHDIVRYGGNTSCVSVLSPGAAMGMAFVTNLVQLKRSWYMFFFQHPLADLVVGANDLAYIDMLWNDWSPGFNGAEALAATKEALRAPENLAAALGYYRATLGNGKKDPDLADLQTRMGSEVPTQPLLYLHGVNDGCIGREVAEFAASTSPSNVEVQFIESAGHFMQLERPDVVADHVIEWIS